MSAEFKSAAKNLGFTLDELVKTRLEKLYGFSETLGWEMFAPCDWTPIRNEIPLSDLKGVVVASDVGGSLLCIISPDNKKLSAVQHWDHSTNQFTEYRGDIELSLEHQADSLLGPEYDDNYGIDDEDTEY